MITLFGITQEGAVWFLDALVLSFALTFAAELISGIGERR